MSGPTEIPKRTGAGLFSSMGNTGQAGQRGGGEDRGVAVGGKDRGGIYFPL